LTDELLFKSCCCSLCPPRYRLGIRGKLGEPGEKKAPIEPAAVTSFGRGGASVVSLSRELPPPRSPSSQLAGGEGRGAAGEIVQRKTKHREKSQRGNLYANPGELDSTR